MTDQIDTTLTARVAAIQIKIFHLQYRMKKIYKDQGRLNKPSICKQKPRKMIKSKVNAVYSIIDMLITFEHLFYLIADIFNTPELNGKLDVELRKQLGIAKDLALKWKPIRNKLGGHIDIDMVESLCEKHGFNGVFLSDDIEADISALNMLLIESAVNAVILETNIFGRKLDFNKYGISDESKLFMETLNKDWFQVFDYFGPMVDFLYKHGKKEKMENSNPDDWKGIIRD